MTLTLRRTGAAVAAAGTALLLTTGVTGPSSAASAATKPAAASASVHVENTAGTGVGGIEVYAYSTKAMSFLGVTDEDGDIATTRGGLEYYGSTTAKLTAGKWTFVYNDTDEENNKTGTPYFTDDYVTTKLAAGDANVVRQTVQRSAHISGRLVSPSGAGLSIGYAVIPEGMNPDDLQYGSGTGPDGVFDASYLGAGTYQVWYQPKRSAGTMKKVGEPVTVTDEAQQVPLGDLAVRVGVEKFSLTAVSKKPGKVVITLTYSAKKAGVTDPGGFLDVSMKGKPIMGDFQYGATDGVATQTTTLTDQKAGKRTYDVGIVDGDLLDFAKPVTVTVR